MAFAGDPALNIYRLKGRFRLIDGRMILLHKVGADIAFENVEVALEQSQFVAIGTKPDFNRAHTAHAWTEIIGQPHKAA
jgi:hypothetical protein